jgi:hypothetical protein
LTIFLALPNEATISEVKEQVLSAFSDDVFQGIRDVPTIAGLDDFVLSREVVGRGRSASYEVLSNDQMLTDVVGNWAILFVQFKDDSGARKCHSLRSPCLRSVSPGRIQPVQVTIPSLTDDDDDVSATPNGGIDLQMEIDDAFEESSVRKGKRKAVS